MPCGVARYLRTDSSARRANPSSRPMPARTQKPCGSMKIFPSAHSFDPTLLPKSSYARRNHSPSQPCPRTGFRSDARQNAETLRLDEDLSLGALLRSDLVAEVVIRAQEPLAVPAVPADGFPI